MAGPNRFSQLYVSNRKINSTNVPLEVAVVDGSGNQVTSFGSGGTQYTDGDVDASITGTAVMFDNGTNTVRAVSTALPLPVSVIGGGAGGTAQADQAAFSTGTTNETPIGGIVLAGASDVPTGRTGAVRMSSVRALWTFPVDSSGGVVTDSTQRAIRITSVDAGGSTQVTVSTGRMVVQNSSAGDLLATMSPAAGSTWNVRPLQSSAADLQVTATPAAGSTFNVRPLQSSAADLQVTATPAAGSTFNTRPLQSSAADLQMTATPAAGSTWNVRPLQSSQADLRVTVYQSTAAELKATVTPDSTAWTIQARVTTSSGAGVEGSTSTPSTGGVLGLNVREVQPSGRQSTSILVLIQTAGGSTTLVSSAAGLKQCVYAYSVMSTIVGFSSCAFLSSAGTAERWGLILGSGSSGITGANLAIAPPGFLFQTNTAEALSFAASSTGLYRVSISWFTEA